MSRPCPKILLERVDQKKFRSEQVLEAEAIYAVFYEGRPINMRLIDELAVTANPKYIKVSFSNPGFAHNLQDRLNKQYKTDKFCVMKLVDGSLIEEPQKAS